ncbi:MAG: Holliday junction resolvase RuvX [Candidatus Komeilibacteria bacterium]|jgi:putative holliday junction resolvase|nr:Holliday junction resolvase RuvX [Candidatus Komeilibacteria bacterium]MBT4448002.1 Holliday junction resolvase RuvX [Candidatus Komeilibacteria bacterium]
MKNKFLGIDYGDKRVGLSLAEDKGPALPFKILQNTKKLIQDIQEIIDQEYISEVVVGLPHSFSGQENERLIITKNFIKKLQDNLEIKVATVDEQLTSKLYEKMGVTKDIDKHSATAILDTYLSQNDS